MLLYFSVTGRKVDDDERNRAQLISRVEDFLWRFSGVNGHACMLRTLCEVAQVSNVCINEP